jgi:hypothetical protein
MSNNSSESYDCGSIVKIVGILTNSSSQYRQVRKRRHFETLIDFGHCDHSEAQ